MSVAAARAGLGLFGRTIALIWTTSPGTTAALLIGLLVQGLAPVARLWVGKLIVDEIALALSRGAADLASLAPLILLELGLTVLGALLAAVTGAAQAALAHRVRERVGESIMQVAISLDYAQIEEPAFHDRLRRAQVEATYRPLTFVMLLGITLTGLVSLLGIAALLFQMSVLATAVVILCSAPPFAVRARAARMRFGANLFESPAKRRMDYLSELAVVPRSAKEVRLFGLGGYLLDGYRASSREILREYLRIARYEQGAGAAAALVATVGQFAAYAYLIAEVLAGRLTIGDLVVYGGALVQIGAQVQQVGVGVAGMLENGLFLRDLFEFLTLPPDRLTPLPLGVDGPGDGRSYAGPSHGGPGNSSSASTEAARNRPAAVKTDAAGIVFEDVHFRYPGRSDDAVRGVSLRVPRGRIVAIVGESGAGKTTLIKLLCRLYEPTAGRILLDGTDIRDLDPRDLRAQLGILFQDFVQYHLTVRENVGFGDVAQLDDLGRIQQAADRAGAAGFIDALPAGYDTRLGTVFDEGHELSGGEWQRVALARSYMRDAPILVLDEPTASLDPRAEQRVFAEVRRLIAGRTGILISHRFSTVRLADEISVLHDGMVAEHGSHEALVARRGRYAELYELQASAYR